MEQISQGATATEPVLQSLGVAATEPTCCSTEACTPKRPCSTTEVTATRSLHTATRVGENGSRDLTSNTAKEKRDNLGVALEIHRLERSCHSDETPGGCELQALSGGAELRGQEVSGEGEKQPDEQSLQL